MKVRNNRRINSIFGCPYTRSMYLNKQWYADNIVRVDLPFKMYLAWDTDREVAQISVHKTVAKKFQKALQSVADKARQLCKQEYALPGGLTPEELTGFYDQKVAEFLHELHLDLLGGAYNFRKMRGSSNISLHSYGIAIDIDPGHNPMGKSTTTLPKWYVACWTSLGFIWGGDWKNKPDSMHFEIRSP